MLKSKLVTLIIFSCLLLFCNTAFAYYDGEGVDMGYWCTDCNRQHGPGETCPRQGGSYDHEDYEPEQPYVDPTVEEHNEANRINKEGIIYYKNKDYGAAVDRFKQALEKWPDNATIKSNYDNAVREYEWEKGRPERERIEAEKERQELFDWRLLYHHKMIKIPLYDTKVVDANFVNNIDVSSVEVQGDVKDPAELRNALIKDTIDTVQKRMQNPNYQAAEILRSLKIKEPPSPAKLTKNISELAAGDVILVAPNDPVSSLLNKTDKWASDYPHSPASHTATFLGERDGKRWYMNTTFGSRPTIMEEKDFMKEYGGRAMDVAKLVGQPLNPHEGQELWKGALEMEKAGGYGLKIIPAINGDDNMVCSELSRWLLMRAGRRMPESRSEDKTVLGMKLSKKDIVKFSPADFYDNEQYFIVHTLNTDEKPEQKN